MHRPRFTRKSVAVATLLACAGLTQAETNAPPRVDVIGGAERLPTLAGSAHTLDEEALRSAQVFTVNEALRKIPGINARDEEGFGLRPNLGMRGLNPTRSTKIALLEDGIPLAYAPYGDNASYYHPQVDRYDRIEVLKGAAALRFGPQTVGGIVNYITPIPPATPQATLQAALGNRNFRNLRLSAGGHGLRADYALKEGDGARDNMHHRLDDLNLKYVAALGERQGLTLRANRYAEDSTITYSGLTQAEYDRLGPHYNPFKNDRFTTDRSGASATHEIDFGSHANLITNFYYASFDRDWWRQASNSQDGQCGAAFNAARLAGTRVDPDRCNSTQGRLRSYRTVGVEPRLLLANGLGEFEAALKWHAEEQNRRQINAAAPRGRSGNLVENNWRETTALSALLAQRIDFGPWALTPSLRHERIDAERENQLNGQRGATALNKTLPGLGLTWQPRPDLTLFASAHRGFAPPRVEDLIGGNGTLTDVDAESSTNLELGLRTRLATRTELQAAVFRADYDNLIAVGSIAGGSTPLAQGQALFQGLELAANSALDNGWLARLAATWLPTAEQTTPFVNVASKTPVGGSRAGNRQPYAPRLTLTAAVGRNWGDWRAELEAQHVSSQFSDFANSVVPAASGQTGRIDAHTVWNAALTRRLDGGHEWFLTLKNLADSVYIVDRTRGIQVGMPRLIQGGLRLRY